MVARLLPVPLSMPALSPPGDRWYDVCLGFIPVVTVSRAPHHFRSSETQATPDGRFAHQCLLSHLPWLPSLSFTLSMRVIGRGQCIYLCIYLLKAYTLTSKRTNNGQHEHRSSLIEPQAAASGANESEIASADRHMTVESTVGGNVGCERTDWGLAAACSSLCITWRRAPASRQPSSSKRGHVH